MDSPIAVRTSRVRTLAAQRPTQIAVAAIMLLLTAAAWFAASRAALPTSRAATNLDASRVAAVPSRDEAMQTWIIPAPTEVRITPRPVPKVDPTDWSALSLGVAGVAPVATLATSAARPAELATAMSENERRMLLASVKSGEPEGLPSPQGYTPGIVVIVPASSGSDGICR